MPTARQILDNLIDLFTGNLRAAFLAAISDVVDNAMIADMAEAIRAGDYESVFRAVGYSDAAMRPITAEIERSFERAGQAIGNTFPKILNTPSGRAIFRFDVRNSRAETYLRDKSSTLITRIGDDARVNVRNTMVAGMEAGRNPRNVALDIVGRLDRATGHRVGGVIGLTQQQEYWVRSTRKKLEQLDGGYFKLKLRDKRFDRTVMVAIRDKKPLPVDTIEKLVTRYKDNALKYRGETIARTEAIQSLNSADYEATKQAVEMGAVRRNNVKREWDDSGDNRVRHTHHAMNGQVVGLDEPFISPSGAQLMYPGDTSLGADASEVIDCRCRAKSKIDWLADLD